MNTLVPIEQAARMISPAMRARMEAGKALNNNFSDGVRDAFPILSIKGKVFRARVNGEETAFIDPNTRQPVPFLDIVLVNGSRTLSKAYYAKGFTEGDMNPPDCWSLDSFKPDASVAQKMAATCQNCPMNQFGSKITDNGKQAKACQDARRVAVVMPHQLDTNEQMLLLLRVPQSSLKNLKAYVNLLERHSVEPGACITRIAFDYNEAFPKLLFNFVSPLNDEQFNTVIELADAPNTQAMLSAPDFENAPSTQPMPNATAQSMQGLKPQDPPVLASASASYSANNQAAKPVSAGLINLPDGRLYDPVNQTYVEVEEEEEEAAPVADPNIITLPDGKKFNMKTQQYVDVPAPKVEEKPKPVLDPDTFKMPDGKYYNQVLKSYVTGPHKGDPVLTADEPAKAETKAAPKKRAPAKKKETAQAEMTLAANTESAEEVEEEQEVSQTTGAEVTAAPQSLEQLLTILVPQPN